MGGIAAEAASLSFVVFTLSTVLSAAVHYYPNLPPPYQYPYTYPYPNQNPIPQPAFYGRTLGGHGIANSTYVIRGHDFALGTESPREKILLHTTVYKKPGFWSRVATKEITFPPRGSRLRVNITRIHATDRARNGTGAFVKLVGGGIGQQNVTLLFRSQENQPINFELDIFGHPK